jgi:phage/plasmid-like protein (TIGR03299 family)
MTDTFAGRTAPWRSIKDATVFDGNVSTKEMLALSKLSNWNVRTVALEDVIVDDYTIANDLYATVRDTDNGPEVIGTVGSRYHPLQNEQAFDWVDTILDGGGVWDTAGSFNNGSKVFGSMLISTDKIVVDRNGLNDAIDLYLMVSNSHDGSLPLQSSITPVRVRCQNTFQLALNQINRAAAPQTFKIRHTVSAEFKVEIAREALRLSFAYADEFDKLANEMFNTHVDANKFNEIVRSIYPMPDGNSVERGDKTAMTRWANTIDLLNEIRVSPSNDGIANTAWGTYNILTERMDWFRKSSNEEAKALAASGFSVSAVQEKNKLLHAVLQHTA